MGKIGDLLDIFCDNGFDNKKNQFFFCLFWLCDQYYWAYIWYHGGLIVILAYSLLYQTHTEKGLIN
jgi:hypothetical protein